MSGLLNKIELKGDKTLWALIALLALFSILPVYSASSGLAFTQSGGNIWGYLIKHFVHLTIGFSLIYFFHQLNYKYLSGISLLLLPVVIVLLIVTLLQGKVIGGANASRWLKDPIFGFTFQTSAFATVVLIIYTARFLYKTRDIQLSLKEYFLPFFLPVIFIIGLILPANLSTAAIIFVIIAIILFIGGFPIKYLTYIVGSGIAVLALFILLVKAFPDIMPNRVDTWTSRIDVFMDKNSESDQQKIAKSAISLGGLMGKGPGNSTQKDFLPQSSSDFVFAVIIEEYGSIGAIIIISIYFILLYRFIVIATKAKSIFGALLVVGLGLTVIFQAFINMGVAVTLLPVTGQTLPLVSSGGTSIWMTCISIGIILSVSNFNKPTDLVIEDNELEESSLNETSITNE